MREIKNILRAWQNSRVLKKIGTEYPSKSTVFLGASYGFDFCQYLNEEECDVIDKAILALKNDNYDQWAVVTAIYIKGYNCNKLSTVLGIKKDKVYRMLDDAERFIQGHIYHFFCNNV